jgi:hypothetical protein
MDEFFSTQDICMASTLVCLGHKIETIDKSRPKSIHFLFLNTGNVRSDVVRFWDGLVRIEPKEFWSTFRNIKGRIMSNYE